MKYLKYYKIVLSVYFLSFCSFADIIEIGSFQNVFFREDYEIGGWLKVEYGGMTLLHYSNYSIENENVQIVIDEENSNFSDLAMKLADGEENLFNFPCNFRRNASFISDYEISGNNTTDLYDVVASGTDITSVVFDIQYSVYEISQGYWGNFIDLKCTTFGDNHQSVPEPPTVGLLSFSILLLLFSCRGLKKRKS